MRTMALRSSSSSSSMVMPFVFHSFTLLFLNGNCCCVVFSEPQSSCSGLFFFCCHYNLSSSLFFCLAKCHQMNNGTEPFSHSKKEWIEASGLPPPPPPIIIFSGYYHCPHIFDSVMKRAIILILSHSEELLINVLVLVCLAFTVLWRSHMQDRVNLAVHVVPVLGLNPCLTSRTWNALFLVGT